MRNLIYVLCIFLLACSGETFTVIPLVMNAPESGVEASADGIANSDAAPEAMVALDTGVEVSISDSGAVKKCPDPNDVEYMGRCYYLDGSGGVCDQGYTLSSNARLGQILGANPNAWETKNYRHQVSDMCCIRTIDMQQNYGMTAHANKPGPFGAGEPVWNGSSCQGSTSMFPKQLTVCESL